MSGLAAGLTARGRFANRLGCAEGIGRRRHGGIGGVVAEPRQQIADNGFQLGHAPLQFGDANIPLAASWTTRSIHARHATKSSRAQLRGFSRWLAVNGYKENWSNAIPTADPHPP